MKYCLLSLSLFVVAACGNSDPTEVPTADPVAPMANDPQVVSSPDAVTEPWAAATASYLELKDAFVASELAAAKTAATRLVAELADADMAAMGAQHDAWMKYALPVQRTAEQIPEAEDLAVARQAFAELTEPMVAAVGALGDGGADLYVQHCPMAFDNAGADWVAAEREVRNPYFGDAMLTCGRVVSEL